MKPLLTSTSESTEQEMADYLIAEAGQAKQMLRDYGFGVTGTNLIRTVQQALDELERLGYERP